jgi:Tol biopolymer transport system component
MTVRGTLLIAVVACVLVGRLLPAWGADARGLERTFTNAAKIAEPAQAGFALAFLRGRELHFVRSDGRLVRRVRLPGEASLPYWSRDGAKMVFGDRGPRAALHVANGDGSRQRVLARFASFDCFEVDWHPTRYRVVFAINAGCESPAEIYVINADGSGRRRLVRGGLEPVRGGYAPAWSPDGRRILFKFNALEVVGADGRGRRKIPHARPTYPAGVGDEGTLAWSRDGRRAFFIDEARGLSVVGLDGKGLRRLTRGDMVVTAFQVSPRRNEIVLAAAPKGGNSDEEIYILHSDGTGLTALTENAGIPDKAPTWSPDGQTIAFQRGRTAPAIFIVNRDGKGKRRVAATAASEPRWVRQAPNRD